MEILFSNSRLTVGIPETEGDIFVWPTDNPAVKARISLDSRAWLSVTAADSVIIPISKNGLPGFRIC
jgi:hypothetical protein